MRRRSIICWPSRPRRCWSALAPNYDHLLAATTAVGKNIMPRVAALLDVQPISDIAEVVDADTFIRPIYAGNGMATVKSSDAKKVITVRAASFDPVRGRGRQRADRGGATCRICRRCRASSRPSCRRASARN